MLSNTSGQKTALLLSKVSPTLSASTAIGTVRAALAADGCTSVRPSAALEATATSTTGRAACLARVGTVAVPAAGAADGTTFHGVISAFTVSG